MYLEFTKNLYPISVPETIRLIHDPEKTRQWLIEKILQALKKRLNSLETDTLKLQVSNLQYKIPKNFKDPYILTRAIMKQKSLLIPVKGEVSLIDKTTNKVIDKKDLVLCHIPYITPRNTIILDGVEYSIQNQLRLKPGLYTRFRYTGEPELFINVPAQTKLAGRIIFQPQTGQFIYRIGTQNFHLYSILHDLGISDETLAKYWGKEIVEMNRKEYSPTESKAFYNFLTEK